MLLLGSASHPVAELRRDAHIQNCVDCGDVLNPPELQIDEWRICRVVENISCGKVSSAIGKKALALPE